MSVQDAELLEKIRQQFDFGPYPRIPLEQSPQDAFNELFIHSMATPYYLRDQRVINPVGQVILDAGCGSGYKSLVLATANPGAQIVGIDLSEESVNLARQRLKYHGVENAEFHVLAIEDLPALNRKFDYINCDEVLYLFPDPALGLQAMRSVLAPQGIIRSNLHSALQRFSYFRSQELFKLMGLMDGNPEELEIEIAIETLKALKKDVDLKLRVWRDEYEQEEGKKERVLMNLLFQGDKGYTITDLFEALRSAELEFISMLNWRQWEVSELFEDAEDLPPFWAMSLPSISIEERLRIFELLHPVHRLIDFWCGLSDQAQPVLSVSEWEPSDWEKAQVHLHPVLKHAQVRAELTDCINKQRAFKISHYISASSREGTVTSIDSTAASYLLPLLEGPQPFMALVDRWLKVRPVDPVTLEPMSATRAFDEVKTVMTQLELYLYVLLER